MKKTFETLKSHKHFNYIKLGLILIGILFLLNYVSVNAWKDIGDPPPIIYYTVTAVAGSNGSISPTSRSVNNGFFATFTVTPNSGYIASASGCNGYLSGTTYTTGTINANCTVTATFTRAPALPPTVEEFKAVPSSVYLNTSSKLIWQTSDAISCTLSGGIFSNFSVPVDNLIGTDTGPLSTPTTYTLSCTNGDFNTGSTNICEGTVTGSKVWALACYPEGSGSLDPSPYYCYVPGPYEGQSCTQFTSQSTCLQGWLTHGCSWITPI